MPSLPSLLLTLLMIVIAAVDEVWRDVRWRWCVCCSGLFGLPLPLPSIQCVWREDGDDGEAVGEGDVELVSRLGVLRWPLFETLLSLSAMGLLLWISVEL